MNTISSKIKSVISRNKTNALGWKTKRKIVVFESDDWGSIRMRDKNAYKALLNKNIRVDLCPYNKYDTIASHTDLMALFDTLDKFRDINNRPPIITFNTNTANPDFVKVKDSAFQDYYYKEFTETINEYYPNQNVFDSWKEGIEKKYIYPQYHHREHINTQLWLKLLREGHKPLRLAFDQNVFGLSFITSKDIKTPYLGSLIYTDEKSFNEITTAIIDGANIFENTFNFKSKSMIAPIYAWDKMMEKSMHKADIKYIQGGNIQRVYDKKSFISKKTINYLGSKSDFGQVYLNRNCSFEPSIQHGNINLDNVMRQINSAFFWNKPAVFSSHRLNFIGSLEEQNRNKNLSLLSMLLERIQKRWPDVEFMHSSELGDIITKSSDEQ